MREMNYNKIFGSVMVAGFVIGILYTNLFVSNELILNGALSATYLQEYLAKEIVLSEYFFSVLWVRCFPLIVLAVLKNTKFIKVIIIGALLWGGYLLGVYLSVGLLSLGIKGLIFCILGLFPHMLLYVPAYYVLLIYVWAYPRYKWNLSKSILIILCMMCGIVVECNVNPMILKWFIGIM